MTILVPIVFLRNVILFPHLKKNQFGHKVFKNDSIWSQHIIQYAVTTNFLKE